MQQHPVILLDVMDTLVYNPFRDEIPAFFGLSGETLVAQKDPHAWTRFELGEIDEAEYFRRYFRNRQTFDHAALRRVVQDAYRWLAGVEDILIQLRDAGFEMHALSNYPVWYRTIEAKLQLSRYLQWTFVSCHTGVRKPAREAYEGPSRRLNRPVQDFLFIDDRPENCEAARASGMAAIPFVDAAQLRSQLRDQGLLT